MKKYPIDYNHEEMFYFNLYVSDLSKAKAFYLDIFGFEISFDSGEEVGWVELSLPIKGVKIGLNLEPNKILNPENTALVIGVNNIDATRDYIIKKNLNCTKITDIPDMVSYFSFWDPFDNKIQFLGQPRQKS